MRSLRYRRKCDHYDIERNMIILISNEMRSFRYRRKRDHYFDIERNDIIITISNEMKPLRSISNKMISLFWYIEMKYVSQAWFEPTTTAFQAIEIYYGFAKMNQIKYLLHACEGVQPLTYIKGTNRNHSTKLIPMKNTSIYIIYIFNKTGTYSTYAYA